ncbi:MAG: CBS domain-containing protein [Acidimicrobiales bacterium]
MSPRAACRLEILGFSTVYDYTGGKVDWLAAGLPTEGPGAATPRPGTIARTGAPTCAMNETVAVARSRVEASDEERCVVLSGTGIVLGILDDAALANDGEHTAGDAIRPGPATVRAHEDLGALLGRMHSRDVGSILVTDPDGRLIGSLHRDDGDAVLADVPPEPSGSGS